MASEAEYRAVECPICEGAGEWDEGPLNCSSSGGAVDPEYRQVICPECEGTGEVVEEVEPITLADLGETCPDCCGTGIAGHPDSNKKCARCNGNGDTTPTPNNPRG